MLNEFLGIFSCILSVPQDMNNIYVKIHREKYCLEVQAIKWN